MEISIWLQSILVGIGATLIMDSWSWSWWQKNVLHNPTLDYTFVGR